MRNIKTLVCVLGFVVTSGRGTLLAATPPQVIVLGEVVHRSAPSSGPSLAFDLTAVSDGWVAVSLNWDPQQGTLGLFGDVVYSDPNELAGTIQVVVWMVAGHTYRFWVGPVLYDSYVGDLPFVLTTTESEPPTPPQVIVLGEVVHGTLLADGPDLAFQLTAPSRGILGLQLTWDPGQGDLRIHFENGDEFGFDGTFHEGVYFVEAGRTYTFWIAHPYPCDFDFFGDYHPPCNDGQQRDIPFVLTLYMEQLSPLPPPPPPLPPPFPLPPPPPPSPGCTTSDPFTSLGGGTCVNGGWLPPGMTPPGVNPTLPPLPAPPPPSSGDCTTPDPFAALGGGTCANGGWWPPGLTPPGVNPNPPPSSPPPPSPGGCTTPDPFVSLGGGTCFNGGWWPPGLLPPIVSIVIR